MFATTYIRYIVQRISILLYTRHPANTSLVVPLLSHSCEKGSERSSDAQPPLYTNPSFPMEPRANHTFWKEEEQRQVNQEAVMQEHKQ